MDESHGGREALKAESPGASLRIGIVPYLNMLPLLEGLREDLPQAQWTRATPRELADRLAAGELDVAAVSTHEGLRREGDYTLLPGAALGCDGAVRSVALHARVPLGKIRRVLLDRASLTSIHLARILAAEWLGIDPSWHLSAEPVEGAGWPEEYDACVVIGDTALRWEGRFPHQLDLGEGWKRLTGLPFVFAGWWARREAAITAQEAATFARARERGVAAIEEITARLDDNTARQFHGRESLLRYFREAMVYDLGPRQWEAIALYRAKLIQHGLLDAAPSPTAPIRPS